MWSALTSVRERGWQGAFVNSMDNSLIPKFLSFWKVSFSCKYALSWNLPNHPSDDMNVAPSSVDRDYYICSTLTDWLPNQFENQSPPRFLRTILFNSPNLMFDTRSTMVRDLVKLLLLAKSGSDSKLRNLTLFLLPDIMFTVQAEIIRYLKLSVCLNWDNVCLMSFHWKKKPLVS